MKNTAVTKRGILLLLALTSGCCEVQLGDDMSDTFKGSNPNNIGNSVVVSPAQSPGEAPDGLGPVKTVVKYQPAGTGGWRTSAETNVAEWDASVISASISATPPAPGTNSPGPIVGIAIWASGSGQAQTAEFDIPVTTDSNPLASPPVGPKNGGTVISVVATSLEIRARNDANFIPPQIGATPNAPIGTAANGDAVVTASLGKDVARTSRVMKTVWLINRPTGGAGGLPVGSSVSAFIPAFATSFRVARATTGAVGGTAAPACRVVIGGVPNGGASFWDGGYSIASGVLSPEFLLSGQENEVSIFNSDGAASIDSLAIIFFLSL